MYFTENIIYNIFDQTDNIVDFIKFERLNKEFHKISVLFKYKKYRMLLEYFILNNSYDNYINYLKYFELYKNFVNIDRLLDFNLNNFEKIIIEKNNLKYYDLHYIYELLLHGATIDRNSSRKILIFCDRLISSFNFNNSYNNINKFLTNINIRRDALCNNSLIYI